MEKRIKKVKEDYEDDFDNDFDGEVGEEDGFEVAEEEDAYSTPQMKQEQVDPDLFSANAGSEETSTGHEVLKADYPKVESLMITKSGAWGINIPGKDRHTTLTLKDPDGTNCTALQVCFSDGSETGRRRGYYLKSTIRLDDDKVRMMNDALSELGAPYTIGNYINAFGDCTGGLAEFNGDSTEKKGLSVDLYDRIVAAFIKRQNIFRWSTITADFSRLYEKYRCDWNLNVNGEKRPNYFREDCVGGNKHKLVNVYYWVHIKNIRAVPETVEVPVIHKSKVGRAFRFTHYQSRAFTIFEKACASAFAINKGVHVSRILRGPIRKEFDKWFQTLIVDFTIHSFTQGNYGEQNHPRMWSAIKEDRSVRGEIKTKGMGVSIYEAMKTQQFADAISGHDNASPLEEEDVKKYWIECCGKHMIVSKGGKRILKVDKEEVRKTR